MNRKKFLGLLGLAAATPILAKGLEVEKTEPTLKATEIKGVHVPDTGLSTGQLLTMTSNVTASWHDPMEGFKVYRTTYLGPVVEFSAQPYELIIGPNGRNTQTSNGNNK